MTALATWCHHHRLAVILLWAATLTALGIAALTTTNNYSSNFTLTGTNSAHATAILTTEFPAAAGDPATLVWHTDTGTVRTPAVETRIQHLLTAAATLPGVTSIANPYNTSGPGQISPHGHTAYATINLATSTTQPTTAELAPLTKAAQQAATPTLHIDLGGDAVQQTTQSPAVNSELIGIIAAAIVLLAAFGSILATALPLLTGIAGVGCGLLATGLLTHTMTIASFAPTLGALIGLGVGIDYALFIVTRHRCALRRGATPAQAITTAINTSGRAVLFAGGTVCAALLGMFALDLGFLDGVALAATITVAFTVLAALTLLPALLSFLGTRVLSRRQRRELTTTTTTPANPPPSEHAIWRRWAGIVQRRPRLTSLAALLLMLALAIPALSLRLGTSDTGNAPTGSSAHQAYQLITHGFGPGANGPLILTAETPTPAATTAFQHLATTLRATPGIASVTAPLTSPNGQAGLIQAAPTTSPQSAQTTELIHHLRTDTIPAAENHTGLKVYVGGVTATYADFATVLSAKLPLFTALIALLGFALLVVAFRCLLVPLTAALMNLLAAAAAFGVVTAVFEWGWGASGLGMGAAGPVEAFLPVMLLAILFGLSMDYQVFLVSRMHEDWVQHGDNGRAVRTGQVETSRVITAAATIMICVFSCFAFDTARIIGEFGVGLAAAVALDAFVIRTVLVPATMHLFGQANWWLPGWLDRILPTLHVEPTAGRRYPPPHRTPQPTPARPQAAAHAAAQAARARLLPPPAIPAIPQSD